MSQLGKGLVFMFVWIVSINWTLLIYKRSQNSIARVERPKFRSLDMLHVCLASHDKHTYLLRSLSRFPAFHSFFVLPALAFKPFVSGEITRCYYRHEISSVQAGQGSPGGVLRRLILQ